MIEIGRVCIKTAGRDAGLKCVVIDIVDNKIVLIDGQTRRRKCNITHLEPTKDMLSLKKGASHDDVVQAFNTIKIEIKERKSKPKTERQKKLRKVKEKPKKKGKEAKTKKEEAKIETKEKVETKKEETKETTEEAK